MLELSDVDELLAQAALDRQRGHAAVDAEYDATVEAIRRIKAMLARRSGAGSTSTVNDDLNGEAHPAEEPSPQPESGDQRPWPGLRAAIRESFERYPEGFTLDGVMDYLACFYSGATAKRVAVSGELWRMNRLGEIQILERGSGNKPHKYRKVTDWNGQFPLAAREA